MPVGQVTVIFLPSLLPLPARFLKKDNWKINKLKF